MGKKKILITGENSYVGKRFSRWLSQWPDKYEWDFISLRDDLWRKKDFSQYATIFHVAALVHHKENIQKEEQYYKVNTNLSVELASKAKKEGVKQFIFMSSLSVYGLDGDMKRKVIITKETKCKPQTLYGKSKLKAEELLEILSSDHFKVSLLRVPMIYGPECPGNYQQLKKISLNSPIFPCINNERSMIFIYNLCEFVKLLIENPLSGKFFPQDKEFVNTSELVQKISVLHNHRVFSSAFIGKILNLIGNKVKFVNKGFGSLVIDKSLSNHEDLEYIVYDLNKAITLTEKNDDLIEYKTI